MTLAERSGAMRTRKPIRGLLCDILELSGYIVRLARDGVAL